MKEILTPQMLQEIFSALEKGEAYNYSDANTSVQITPNSLSIMYNRVPDTHDADVTLFLNFCDSLHDDLFIETCESFGEGELKKLQDDLDTPNYKNTINVFTTRVREIANNRLNQIINEADSEIKAHQNAITKAEQAIENIHSALDEAVKKYSL
jgi:hypothetical protein